MYPAMWLTKMKQCSWEKHWHYVQGGDLCKAISNDRSGDLGWYSKGHKLALDVARGLAFLHSCKVRLTDSKENVHDVSLRLILGQFCMKFL